MCFSQCVAVTCYSSLWCEVFQAAFASQSQNGYSGRSPQPSADSLGHKWLCPSGSCKRHYTNEDISDAALWVPARFHSRGKANWDKRNRCLLNLLQVSVTSKVRAQRCQGTFHSILSLGLEGTPRHQRRPAQSREQLGTQ